MPSSSAQNNGRSDAAAPSVRRDILPIPDPQHVGLTTYDAKDPDTTYPPITMLRIGDRQDVAPHGRCRRIRPAVVLR
jgi:hypothetical protein